MKLNNRLLIIFLLLISVSITAEVKTVLFKDGSEKVIDIRYSNNNSISGIDYLTKQKVEYKATEYISISTYLDFYENHKKVIIKKDKTFIRGLSENENLKRIIIKPDNSHTSLTIETKDIAKDGLLPYSVFYHEFNKTRKEAVIRSLIFPGVGQYYSGNKFRAYTIWFLLVTSILYTGDNYMEASRHFANYNNGYIPQDSEYSKHTNAIHRANNGMLFIGAIYLLSIGDAYLSFRNPYDGYKEVIPTVLPSKEVGVKAGFTKPLEWKK